MVDLTGGELFVLCFIAAAVLSSTWWPRLGEAVAGLFAGPSEEEESRDDGVHRGGADRMPPSSE